MGLAQRGRTHERLRQCLDDREDAAKRQIEVLAQPIASRISLFGVNHD